MSRDRSKDPPKTASEFMHEMRQDPEFAKRERELIEQQEANRSAYTAAAAGVLDELHRAGFNVDAVGDLRSAHRRYTKAIPILLSWLTRVTDMNVKQDIVRTLSVPWAREAAPILVTEYRNTLASDFALRWAIGNALAVTATPMAFNDLVELGRDRNGGKSREMIMLAIAKTQAPGATEALVQMLADDEVAGHALEGLAQLEADLPRRIVEPFMQHPAPWVRRVAKRLLSD